MHCKLTIDFTCKILVRNHPHPSDQLFPIAGLNLDILQYILFQTMTRFCNSESDSSMLLKIKRWQNKCEHTSNKRNKNWIEGRTNERTLPCWNFYFGNCVFIARKKWQITVVFNNEGYPFHLRVNSPTFETDWRVNVWVKNNSRW